MTFQWIFKVQQKVQEQFDKELLDISVRIKENNAKTTYFIMVHINPDENNYGKSGLCFKVLNNKVGIESMFEWSNTELQKSTYEITSNIVKKIIDITKLFVINKYDKCESIQK